MRMLADLADVHACSQGTEYLYKSMYMYTIPYGTTVTM